MGQPAAMKIHTWITINNHNSFCTLGSPVQHVSTWYEAIIRQIKHRIHYYASSVTSFHINHVYTAGVQTSHEKHTINRNCLFLCFWRDSPQWARGSSFTRFLDHTQRRTTVGRTPLDEWSARHRDLYLTTHNTHNRHPCLQWDSNPQSQQASGRRPMS
jgi:hypothetical protein